MNTKLLMMASAVAMGMAGIEWTFLPQELLQYIEWFSGTLKLYLREEGEVEVSRWQAQRFRDLLSF